MQYKKEEVRAKIIEVATNEFEIAGYHKASIIKIAKNANVPVGNLYRYFKSKEALFDEVVKNAVNDLPNIILSTYEKDVKLDRNAIEMADKIAFSVAEVYKKYGRQIIILADKSEGTKYENFIKNVVDSTMELFEKSLYGSENSEYKMMAKIIGYGFMNGLLTIIKEASDSNIETYAKKLIIYYFYKIENRI